MKNVIKIALLSTVAMVGTAQADLNLDSLSTIKTTIDTAYKAVGDRGLLATDSTNIQLNSILAKVDAHYGAETITTGDLVFNWETLSYSYEDPEYVNTDTGEVDLTDDITALTAAINTDLIGNSAGIQGYNTNNVATDSEGDTVDTTEDGTAILAALGTSGSLISAKATSLSESITAVQVFLSEGLEAGNLVTTTVYDTDGVTVVTEGLDIKIQDAKASASTVSTALIAIDTFSTESASFNFAQAGVPNSIYSATIVDGFPAGASAYADVVDHFVAD